VCAVASDAYAEGAGRAALALRLPHGMQNTFTNAFEIAIRTSEVFEFAGHRILDVFVLATAAFQDQLYFDLVFFPLVEMNDRSFGAEVVAAVLSGERIDGVGPQLPAPGGLGDSVANGLSDGNLANAHGCVYDESGHARVLTDGALILLRHIDIRRDDVQRLRRLGAGRLTADRDSHRLADVGREIGGGLGYEFN
jgi:hypothetical protein